MKNIKSLNQSLLDHTRWIPALCVGHVWPHATNSRALLGVTCPGVIRQLQYFVQRTYIEPYTIDSKERTFLNTWIDKIVFLMSQTLYLFMHSFFVRPGTASAILSHLSGVLVGYVRRAFSKSWKIDLQNKNVTIINKDSIFIWEIFHWASKDQNHKNFRTKI